MRTQILWCFMVSLVTPRAEKSEPVGEPPKASQKKKARRETWRSRHRSLRSLCKRWLIVSHAIINTYTSFLGYTNGFVALWVGQRVKGDIDLVVPWTEPSELICTKCYTADWVLWWYLYIFYCNCGVGWERIFFFLPICKSGFHFIYCSKEMSWFWRFMCWFYFYFCALQDFSLRWQPYYRQVFYKVT